MARNEEKHVTRLNRLLLQQQREEEEKKNPKRPKLSTLNSVSEIQKWLPSLKRDMDFYLMQSQVACYPARKIAEFSQEIERLKREYQAFVRKLRALDPSVKIVPWTERAYSTRKRSADSQGEGDVPPVKSPTFDREEDSISTADEEVGETPVRCKTDARTFVPIATPILDHDGKYEKLYGYLAEPVQNQVNFQSSRLADEPLQFQRHPLNSDHPTTLLSKPEQKTEKCSGEYDVLRHSKMIKSDIDPDVASRYGELREPINSGPKNPLLNLAEFYGEESSDSDESGNTGVT